MQETLLISMVPSYYDVRMQIAQVHHTRAMRAAGANIYSASNLHPRLHVVIPELVRQIQAKRRETRRDKECKTMVKNEDDVAKQ
jgi:hypothetical protein